METQETTKLAQGVLVDWHDHTAMRPDGVRGIVDEVKMGCDPNTLWCGLHIFIHWGDGSRMVYTTVDSATTLEHDAHCDKWRLH